MQLQVVVALVLIVITRKTASEEGVSSNLALMRPAKESSKFKPDTGAGKAVDGRVDATDVLMHFLTGNTDADPDPYWYVELKDLYLVQTVEVISRADCCQENMETIEVRVGEELNDDKGKTNPLCGEPANLNNIPKYIFRCEIYGRYVTIKKTNIPAQFPLAFFEVMVNKEPTINIAFQKPTKHSAASNGRGSSYAVDGVLAGYIFLTPWGKQYHWLMIDFEESKNVVKIFVVSTGPWRRHWEKVIMTLGDDSTDNGKHNAKIGDIHDFTKEIYSIVYVWPRMIGRYFYFHSLAIEPIYLAELEIYSESMPHINLRTNRLGTHARTFYEGHVAVLDCPAVGYPKPHVAWVRDGVVLQNKTTNTYLKWTINDTTGSSVTYGCYATNVHGKDYYPVTVTVAGRYSMCIKPEEIRDPTRNRFSKQDSSLTPKSDATTFDQNKMCTFFNPQSSRYMKFAASCPAPSSCGTGAPGWLSGPHPKPEDGIQRRKVCFHYDGDCCYKATYISIINCPGMYVYGLVNTVEFDFPARYCFEDDKYFEAFEPFRSMPLLFAAIGGTNNALVNHVVAKESGIEDTSQCLTVCMMNKCRSFNFAKLEKICEVNDDTKDEYLRDLTAKSGFQYYHPMRQPTVVNNGFN